MKKFKKIQAFESAKLTKEQMNKATGGMYASGGCGTSCTRSVCHIDGTTDSDGYYYYYN